LTTQVHPSFRLQPVLPVSGPSEATAVWIIGDTSLGLTFLNVDRQPESLRDRAMGARLIARAKEAGRRWRAGVLHTVGFHRSGFYQRPKRSMFGQIPHD
jgi:hypothetical protein